MLTALLVLATFPVLGFLWCKNLVYRCHSRLLLNIVVGVLVAEAIFLTFYQLLGLSFSGVNELKLLPRIFLNIRDNNQWIACTFWIPVWMWLSRFVGLNLLREALHPPRSLLLIFFTTLLYWYLVLLTHGRGALLSVFFVTLIVAFYLARFLSKKKAFQFLWFQGSAFLTSLLLVFGLRSALPFQNMLGRTVSELGSGSEYAGRVAIALNWLNSWKDHSVFWGHGWGVIPAADPWSKDPHNIYIQILCDGGIWALVIIMIAFFLLRNRLTGSGVLLQVFGVGLLLYQGVDRIWAISSGLYVILLCSSFCCLASSKRLS